MFFAESEERMNLMNKRFYSLTATGMLLLLLAGCVQWSPAGKAAQKVSDMWSGIETAIGKTAMPNWMQTDDAKLKELYGIDAADLDEYVMKTTNDSNAADEYFIAKVKSGKMSAVEAAINGRKDALTTKWKDNQDISSYVSSGQVVKNGDYIMYAVSKDANKAADEFNKLFSK